MARIYAMAGFEISVDHGVLIMRTQGVRKSEHGKDAGRLFDLMENPEVHGVMFDIRDADYQLSPLEWKERCLEIARQCRGRKVAVVQRDEQAEMTAECRVTLQQKGLECEAFASKARAMEWLQQGLDTTRPAQRRLG